jgi:hypothetical protein
MGQVSGNAEGPPVNGGVAIAWDFAVAQGLGDR